MPEYASKTKETEVPTESVPTEKPAEALLETTPAESSANVSSESALAGEPLSIEKPKGSGLARFKSRNLEPEKVETLLTGLPHYPMSAAKDWVRLHPDEAAYWSDEYCFVIVPYRARKTTPCT